MTSYTHAYIHTHTYIHTYTYTYILTNTHKNINTYIHTYIYTYIPLPFSTLPYILRLTYSYLMLLLVGFPRLVLDVVGMMRVLNLLIEELEVPWFYRDFILRPYLQTAQIFA